MMWDGRKGRQVSFEILAAIDLRGGNVVRLRQGDFAREDVYGSDPIAVAQRFVDAGVRWLHVVDLDAARSGGSENRELIRRLLARLGDRVAVEVGGGIRDAPTAGELLAGGARRVVLGTAALTDSDLVRRIVGQHGTEAVAVAVDVRAGRAYGRAWGSDGAGPPVEDAITELAAAGVETFEVTAIDRDGSLEGPDLQLLGRALDVAAAASNRGSVALIASGGIRSIADLDAVRRLGCNGAIVGRALYEGRFRAEDAVAFAARAVAAAAAGDDATEPRPGVLKGMSMQEPTT
jgi:phosphoribosylformimino-5-aminoimidazole carboxamide ribotide isomerase